MSQSAAFQALFEKVYAELRAMAQKQMNDERPGHTLHATELVHEAYLRLLKGDETIDLANKAHFFHAAGEAMRRILIEHARRRGRVKRGGDREKVSLSLVDAALPENPHDLLALDEALGRLEGKDARAAEVVRLRFFAGLTIEQTADAMSLSPRTVKREWEFARAWLSQQLAQTIMSDVDPYWRLKDLFARALELPAGERDSFLASLAGDDPELINQVRALLETHERATGVFSRQNFVLGNDTPGERVGDTIGPYQLLELVGEGGMGIVYKAQQSTPVRRIVALKLIKLGMDTRQVLGRFQSERQALAMMNHRNVAAVYDAGATSAGRPYFVMEWVSGTPITDFCDQHAYSTRRRLELFIQVCDAIQHAHQKAIIHRDIKPGNILVTLEGDTPIVKVIDFGVAKAIAQRLTEQSVFTETGQLIGTPEYMSPEQADLNTIDIDTRTDIYSLGVVLYELLVGTLPFDSKSLCAAAYAKIQAIIRESDPPRPSTRLSSLNPEMAAQIAVRRHTVLAALERELRSELEWIPLKAMRKDAAERYATAVAFSTDIANYLHNRPLIAAPESRVYRTKKFLRRNKGPATAAAAVALALVAGIIGTSLGLVGQSSQRKEAQRQAQIAKEQAAVADAVSAFQSYMLRSADPARMLGDKVTMLQVLTAAEKTLDEGAVRDQPLVEARTREIVGMTFNSLGRSSEAEKNLRQSVATFEKLSPGGSSELATALGHWASILELRGNKSAAEKIYRRAIDMERPLAAPDDPKMIGLLHGLAFLLRDHDIDEAERLLREEISLRRAGNSHDTGFATALHDLGMLQRRRHKFDDAEKLLRESLEQYTATLDPRHPFIASCLHNLGGLMHDQERYPEAEQFYRQSLEIYRKSLPAGHPYTATALNDLGFVLQSQGKFAEAAPLHEEALASFRKSLGNNHWDVGNSESALGQALVGLRRYADAEPHLLEAQRVLCREPRATDEVRRCAILLADLYTHWNLAEPNAGHDAQRIEWSAKLKPSTQP